MMKLALSAIVLTFFFAGASALATDWSPHSRPFDLVWDRNNTDLNGLPVNPQWGYQLDHPGKLPDFAKICGAAFYNAQGQTATATSGSGNNAVNNQTLANICTSQHPTLNVSTSSLVGDWWLAHAAGMSSPYCTSGPNGFNGHLTWTVATYTGTAAWLDWSGDSNFFDNFNLADGDYNLALFPSEYPPDNTASYTTLNDSKSTGYGLGLEFKDTDTVDNAGTTWWQNLVNSVKNGAQPTPFQIFFSAPEYNLFHFPKAVVTGLVGIDGVHGDYTEVHPVFSLALRPWFSEGKGTVTEKWVYFLRDHESGGGCSSNEVVWQPPFLASGISPVFYISLPWPDGATSVKVLDTTQWSWGVSNASVWVGPSHKKGWTAVQVYCQVQPGYACGTDGSVELQYTVPVHSEHKVSASSVPKPATEGEKFREDAFKITDINALFPDPVARANFLKDAKAALAPSTPQPKVKPVPARRLTAEMQASSSSPASPDALTPAKLVPDGVKQQTDAAIKQLVAKYRPGMRPTAQP
ncbi:MAG TPA: hypothetical protein VMD53_02925 [Rhizomicrobium sp.]|nr:hypothetical protein [Rhizomicrobium sp.]